MIHFKKNSNSTVLKKLRTLDIRPPVNIDETFWWIKSQLVELKGNLIFFVVFLISNVRLSNVHLCSVSVFCLWMAYGTYEKVGCVCDGSYMIIIIICKFTYVYCIRMKNEGLFRFIYFEMHFLSILRNEWWN